MTTVSDLVRLLFEYSDFMDKGILLRLRTAAIFSRSEGGIGVAPGLRC